jgi:hypothetical protein
VAVTKPRQQEPLLWLLAAVECLRAVHHRYHILHRRLLPPLTAGYLTKQGHRVRNWKRRWFTLGEDGALTYYGSAGEAKPKGRVRLAVRAGCSRGRA